MIRNATDSYFVGIDNGGTNIKAAVFTAEGEQVCAASEQTPWTVTPEGFHECDMRLLWKETATVIRKSIALSGVSPDNIAAVGCTGHGKGLYLWGKKGAPCYPGIASTDQRAAGIVQEWEEKKIPAKAAAKNLQTTLPCQPAALLAWLKRYRPDAYADIRWIFEAKDYIRFMLTGEAYAEYTDSSGSGLLNLLTKAYDPELLDLYGIREIKDCLPPLRHSAAFCGQVNQEAAACTGLKEGTPVCGGMFDIDACAIAMDLSDPEPICIITGTWSINEYISMEPVAPEDGVNHSLFCIPGYYLIEESSPTSAGNLNWVLGSMFGEYTPDYKTIDELVASADPDSAPLFFPFLYGSNSPNMARAAWVGLHSGHHPADLLRSVYEGVAFSHKQHIDRLLTHRKKPPYVRIAGGAANSDVWMQLFADVLNIPVEVVDVKEPGALGCAMAAAVCCGIYADYRAAANKMVRIRKTFYPNVPYNATFQKKYETYRKLENRLL